jgi:hypothetical protein
MAPVLRLTALAVTLFLMVYPAAAQQLRTVAPQASAAFPFVGSWKGVVAINNENNPVQITIAPFANTFAAKVVVYRDGAWQPSPLAELQFSGDVFSIIFPSGNRYHGMHLEGDTLRGFFFWKSVGQTAPVQFTRQP